MRPMEVSMTTVGPLGWTNAAAVAWGASGRSSAGLADFWARAGKALEAAKAAARAGMRNGCVSFIAYLRLNHRTRARPADGSDEDSPPGGQGRPHRCNSRLCRLLPRGRPQRLRTPKGWPITAGWRRPSRPGRPGRPPSGTAMSFRRAPAEMPMRFAGKKASWACLSEPFGKGYVGWVVAVPAKRGQIL